MKIIVPVPFLGHTSREAERCAFPGSKINSWVHLTPINNQGAWHSGSNLYLSNWKSEACGSLWAQSRSNPPTVSSREARAKKRDPVLKNQIKQTKTNQRDKNSCCFNYVILSSLFGPCWWLRENLGKCQGCHMFSSITTMSTFLLWHILRFFFFFLFAPFTSFSHNATHVCVHTYPLPMPSNPLCVFVSFSLCFLSTIYWVSHS